MEVLTYEMNGKFEEVEFPEEYSEDNSLKENYLIFMHKHFVVNKN